MIMEFQRTVIVDEWWQVRGDGTFHCCDGPLEARTGSGVSFTICEIDEMSIGVVVDEAVPEVARLAMASNKPDWLDSIVFATVASDADASVVAIDAEIAVRGDAEAEACAFAVACAAFSQGAFHAEPELYLLRLQGETLIEVKTEFDWDTETWHGEAARVVVL
jgi:hypothetical protein